jgi:nuclear transport factor 2 (NTF2) superfamily protein
MRIKELPDGELPRNHVKEKWFVHYPHKEIWAFTQNKIRNRTYPYSGADPDKEFHPDGEGKLKESECLSLMTHRSPSIMTGARMVPVEDKVATVGCCTTTRWSTHFVHLYTD